MVTIWRSSALPPVPTTPLEPLAPTEPAPVPTVETDWANPAVALPAGADLADEALSVERSSAVRRHYLA